MNAKTSQNLRFQATVSKEGEFDHPPGEPLARCLSEIITTSGWSTYDFDNWRDCGWEFTCGQGGARLSVVLCQIPNEEWLLQISPESNPGFLGRLFGAKLSAAPQEIHAGAVALQQALSSLDSLHSPRWLWDGFPESANSTPEPLAP